METLTPGKMTCLVCTSDEDVICFMAASYACDVVEVSEDPPIYRFFGPVVPPESITEWSGRDIMVSNLEEKNYQKLISLMVAYPATKFVFCHEKSRFTEAPNWQEARKSLNATLGGFRR